MTQTHSFKKEVAEKTYKSVSFSRSLFALRFTSYTMLLTPAVLGSLTAVEKHASLKNAANSFGRRPLIGQRALPPFDLLRGVEKNCTPGHRRGGRERDPAWVWRRGERQKSFQDRYGRFHWGKREDRTLVAIPWDRETQSKQTRSEDFSQKFFIENKT